MIRLKEEGFRPIRTMTLPAPATRDVILAEGLSVNLRSTSGRFRAETGVLVPSVTADEMRQLDRIATDETGPTLLQMMENAGRNLASMTMDLLASRFRSARIVVLAGGGGNGGGGICGARHLSNHGAHVSLCLATSDHLSDVASLQRKVFQSTTGSEISASQLMEFAPDFIIDALIGYGLKPSHSDTMCRLITWANSQSAPILSLDVPSGVNATTGEVPEEAIRPEWTLALALPKSGLHPKSSGQLFLADIGISTSVIRKVAPEYQSPFENQFIVRLDV